MDSILSRREFLKFAAVATFFTFSKSSLKAAEVPHVVVVGGGFSGATCAKYLKLWGGSSIKVTIIEKDSSYVSPILSNLVLNNKKTVNDLTFTYTNYASKYGINMLNKELISIDSDNKIISLNDNSTLSYDKLVLAPGIDFIKTNDYDVSRVPHAWQAGTQTNLLKNQIDSMQDGDTFVMTIPKSPYRCPPGPYERACVVSDYLKNTKGFSNCKVVVLDENSKIIVEENTFASVFTKNGVDYRPNSVVTYVDDSAKSVIYEENGIDTKTLVANVLNVIPNQKAAGVIFLAGVNNGNWADVDVLNYESTIKKDIHIIGDSQGSSQPKAGHIGNSEAKICADAILREFNGQEPYSSPKTNSACYSPTSSNEASWLTAVYKYDSSTKSMVSANTQVYPAAGTPSSSNYSKMFSWAGNLFSDTFY